MEPGGRGADGGEAAAVQQMHTVPVMPVTRATLRDMFEKKRGEQQISYRVSDFSNKSVAVTVSPLGVSHDKKIRFITLTLLPHPSRGIQHGSYYQGSRHRRHRLGRFSNCKGARTPVVFAVTTSAIPLVNSCTEISN